MTTQTLPQTAVFLLAALVGLAGAPALAQPKAAAPAAAPAGNATAGEGKAQMCIGCHGIPGYQASFPEVHKVPMISGQNAKYIASALAGYQKGDRKHPTMKSIAASLSEQDMLDLAVFYEKQGAGTAAAAKQAEPTPQVAALLQKGACISCHGDNFSKPIDAAYPKLGGQHADYLYVSLRAYQIKGNPHVGRNNAIMAAQVQGYSPAELKAIAKYLGSLDSELRTVQQSRFR